VTLHPTRRTLLFGTLGLIGAGCGASSASEPVAPDEDTLRALSRIERTTGGRLGVYALDTSTGRELAHRADERFAMCSTFKWLLAAAVLSRSERGVLSLDEKIPYGTDDLLEYSPTTSKQIAEGSMTVRALAEAAVTVSDNTAANLLLAKLDGPEGLTRFVRSSGDKITRLDRDEPSLNENEPGDPRDTTSPRAMVGLMQHILCERDALTLPSRERLLHWLRECETGKKRLRAGFPPEWKVGNKTGTGQRNAVNDVAIAVPPARAPVLVAVYASEGSAELYALEAAHVEVARLVARKL
jgi:beta-lactamase class A